MNTCESSPERSHFKPSDIITAKSRLLNKCSERVVIAYGGKQRKCSVRTYCYASCKNDFYPRDFQKHSHAHPMIAAFSNLSGKGLMEIRPPSKEVFPAFMKLFLRKRVFTLRGLSLTVTGRTLCRKSGKTLACYRTFDGKRDLIQLRNSD